MRYKIKRLLAIFRHHIREIVPKSDYLENSMAIIFNWALPPKGISPRGGDKIRKGQVGLLLFVPFLAYVIVLSTIGGNGGNFFVVFVTSIISLLLIASISSFALPRAAFNNTSHKNTPLVSLSVVLVHFLILSALFAILYTVISVYSSFLPYGTTDIADAYLLQKVFSLSTIASILLIIFPNRSFKSTFKKYKYLLSITALNGLLFWICIKLANLL